MPAILSLTFTLSLLSPCLPPDEADDRYQFVVGLCDKGLHDLAAKEAQKFLDQFPQHPKADLARYRLASALFELKRAEEAAPEFRKLVGRKGFEFEAESCLRLGQCELQAKRYPQAATALEQAIGRDKEYLRPAATFLLGEALFRQEKFAEAEARYLDAKRLDKEGQYAKDASYGLAWCAFRQGKHDVAIQRIEEFLKSWRGDPLEQELRLLLGEAHLDSGRPKEALAAYASVGDGPFKDAALRGAGFALAADGDHAGAAREFGKLVSQFPESRFVAEASLQRGIHLLRAGDAPGAVKVLRSPGAGQTAEVLYWRSQAESQSGDREAALASLDRALQSKPERDLESRIRVARGDLLFEMGKPADATREYQQSGSDYAIHAAAIASLNDNRPADAVRLSRQLLEKFPESTYRSAAQLTLGEGLFAQKQYAEAEKAFAGAAEAKGDPKQRARALSRIGWCRYFQGKPDEAARQFTHLAKELPEAAEAEEAFFMVGRCHDERKNAKGTVQAWTRYLEQFPKGEHRAEVLLGLSRLEDGDAGRARIEMLLREQPDHTLADRALYELADRLAAGGKSAEAQAAYRDLLARFPKSTFVAPARYGLAWCLFEAGQAKEAAACLRPVASDSSVSPELAESTCELLVWAEQKAGNLDGAVAAYRQFAQLTKDEARRFRAAKVVSTALKEGKRLSDAQAILDEVIASTRAKEVVAEAQVERAYVSLEQKNVDDAESRVQAALRDAPEAAVVAEACFFVGEARYEKGDDDKAIALYQHASKPKESPVADRALYKEGFSRLRKKDVEGAATCFQKLAEAYPKSELHGESLFLVGESLFRLDRFEDAAEWLTKLRAEAPDHETTPKALFRLGISQCRLERWGDAETSLSDLAMRYPKFENGTEAELWRGRALAALKKHRGAREAFDRVVARDRGVLAARARIGIGKLELLAGRTEEALAEFLKVAVLYAHDEEVAEGLYFAGQCLETLGDGVKARSQYQEVVDKHAESSFAASARKRLQEMKTF